MADYESGSNEERVARRQDLTRDAGANRRQIRAAVLDFNRRIENRIVSARPAPDSASVPSGFREVITQDATLTGSPIVLGVPAGAAAAGTGSGSGSSSPVSIVGDDWIEVTPTEVGFTVTLKPQPGTGDRVLAYHADGTPFLMDGTVCTPP